MPNTAAAAKIAERHALQGGDEMFRVLADAMPQMVWSTLPDGFHDYYNRRWYEFTGVPEGSTDGEGWNGMFHPDDQERAWEKWRHSLATGEPYEVEYRLRDHEGNYRWTIGRAMPLRDPSGKIIRWLGTCTDIDDAKRQAEHNEILSRELSHRIKNIFAVISGLISLTANRAAEARPALSTLLGRIAALGRAHEFARPHSPQSMPSMAEGTFTGLLTQLLSPYEEAGIGRVSITGDDIRIDDRSATPLALVIHELATNSAKYGALSAPGGQLSIAIERSADTLVIVWTEAGGPQVNGPPTRTGFGTELAELSIKRQLGGLIEKDWRPQGLQVRIGLDPSRLHREL